jgi:hypothetical protein
MTKPKCLDTQSNQHPATQNDHLTHIITSKTLEAAIFVTEKGLRWTLEVN